MTSHDYVTRVLNSPLELDALAWDDLLRAQRHPTPFMRHAYLSALHTSGSAVAETGWSPRYITLWSDSSAQAQLLAACPMYLKAHSYGEYVFDWAWANAYAQHGLNYYPKALVAVPFTPVPGSRLLAVDAAARCALLQALVSWCQDHNISSLHMLFAGDDDLRAAQQQSLMQRQTVQFHWHNRENGYLDFDDFLADLSQDKRKKIRQERRKVAQAGVVFRCVQGQDITRADWDFFYRCYERTYLEHGNAPYLTRAFFSAMASEMPEHWLMCIAQRDGQDIACSLIAIGEQAGHRVAWGRYWGTLQRVDCLHFEACYYRPLQWCIAQGYSRFEGGAQGEHKMARALLPALTHSAHWLRHPAFADAVERFLQREGSAVHDYVQDLRGRSPFRSSN